MTNDQEDIAQAAEAEENRAPEAGEVFAAFKTEETPARESDASAPASAGAAVADSSIKTGYETTPAGSEDGPMLDIHAPHEGIHNWKQYLLHMSTVVLGILIAIGLEQSVEAMHRAHQRAELRESLHREAQEAIRAAQNSEVVDVPSIDWINTRRALIEKALATHQRITEPLPRKPHVDSIQPADPAWNAAKSSGMLSLLSQDEVEVYSLADQLIADSQAAFIEGVNAAKKRGQFEFAHSIPGDVNDVDLSKAAPEELEQYRTVLLDEGTAWTQYRTLCEYVRGVETAIGSGETDIEKVQTAKTMYFQSHLR